MTDDATRRCTYEYGIPPTMTTPDESVDVPRPVPGRCPHTVADTETARCLFHHFDPDYPVDRITEQFLDALADEGGMPTFAGGQLSGLRLAGETLTTPSDEPIDLRGATIDGDLDLTDATIEVPLLLDGAAITGSFVATDAEFEAPISLADADVGGRIFLQRADLQGGVVANDMSAGYLDARAWTVAGPTLFSGSEFAANVILARATFDGTLDLRETSFDFGLDVTGTQVDGPLVLSAMACEGDVDLVAGRFGDILGVEMDVGGDADWRHAQVEGDLDLSRSTFDGEAAFDDLSIGGASAELVQTHFNGETSFSTSRFEPDETSFRDATFDEDAWFTYTSFAGDATFQGATFHGFAHLRDATFERDLSLLDAVTTHQTFLHGSTIHGEFTAAGATFDHFQFSATVHGDASFEGTRFDESGIFSRSEFGGRTVFDRASFAGGPEFDDARFTGPVTFEGTEFLVEPTFDGTRFAIDPDLEAAEYPMPASRDLDDLRTSMVLARPETLQHTGLEISTADVSDDIVIPAKTSHLVEDKLERTKVVTKALGSLDGSDWHTLFEDPLRTARTAVAQLPNEGKSMLVFGIGVDPEAESFESFITEGSVVGVYNRDDTTIEFGHLDTDIHDIDYLIPVPADDDAFEAGASVTVRSELATAMVRQQAFRTALLEKREGEPQNINTALLPVLVGIAKAS